MIEGTTASNQLEEMGTECMNGVHTFEAFEGAFADTFEDTLQDTLNTTTKQNEYDKPMDMEIAETALDEVEPAGEAGEDGYPDTSEPTPPTDSPGREGDNEERDLLRPEHQ